MSFKVGDVFHIQGEALEVIDITADTVMARFCRPQSGELELVSEEPKVAAGPSDDAGDAGAPAAETSSGNFAEDKPSRRARRKR